MRRTEALIAGGGPAGTAAAITLARSGRKPLLIERSQGDQDIVCGGFLGADALASLARLGVSVSDLGAPAIHILGLIAGKTKAEAPLPFAAAGCSRRALDAALRAEAAHAGADVLTGVAIRAVDPQTMTASLSDGQTVTADALFLATGKHELRGLSRAIEQGADLPLGLRLALEPSTALRDALTGRIELFLFDHGYGGLLLQEDGMANLCLTVARERLVAVGGSPPALLDALATECPLLGDRLAAARFDARWAAIANVPYGWRTANTTSGIFRLGDQAAVIASLAGDGIAIALSSGQAAAHAYLQHGSGHAHAYQAGFARRAARPLALASLLRSAAERPALARLAINTIRRFPILTRAAARTTRIEHIE